MQAWLLLSEHADERQDGVRELPPKPFPDWPATGTDRHIAWLGEHQLQQKRSRRRDPDSPTQFPGAQPSRRLKCLPSGLVARRR